MRGGSLQKFKVYTPSGGQKGGTLFKFIHPAYPPPFLGTWDQIQRQRGAGMLDDFAGLKRGGKNKSLSEARRGVKRAASNAILNELHRPKKIKDIFG